MRDLPQCPNSGWGAIRISGDSVVLELNGHRLGMRHAGFQTSSAIEVGGSYVTIVGPGTLTAYLDKAIRLGGYWNTVRDLHLAGFDLGIEIFGSNNTIERVSFAGGGYAAIHESVGGHNTFRFNRVDGHLENGFNAWADSDQVIGNRIAGAGVGIQIGRATGSLVAENVIVASGIGILVGGGKGNVIRQNDVQNNAYDLFDLSETTCTDNTWIDNIFTTATQPCMH
jgi:parallel beta-helix repeat protein